MKKNNKIKRNINKLSLPVNITVICLSYGFNGINFILSCIIENNCNDVYCKNSLFLGVVMLCMVPISYFDQRKEMRGKFSVIMSCIMHLVISIWISYVQWSWKIMAIYIIEVIMIMGIIWTVKRNGRSGAGKL